MTDLAAALVRRAPPSADDRPGFVYPPMEQVAARLEEVLDAHDRGEPPPPPATASSVGVPPGVAVGAPRRLAAPGWTPARQRAFIEHLAAEGCVAHAARAIGLSKQSAYQLRDRSPNSIFALAWDVAIARSRRLLLDVATEWALAGREVPVIHRGEEVGTRVVHSERLLMFLLGLKRESPHPNLSEHELAELWPAMLEEIDAVLPPTLTPERIERLRTGDDPETIR